ncbi:hypothetical protein M0G74_18070 [Microbulbifer sp. CAU 1566]|uniref:DUF4124 domain-containing protein n=1 Tax=Microbulbifer sp. CAU 1566 TaxID=2933269 RepID=UPI002005749C|nr:DUF4124 domain-containing protein [Microbulbifer sp. CAU 1566]MCK7599185.1 hypothetical protein [Microbulbifer sp. CAU 1566]
MKKTSKLLVILYAIFCSSIALANVFKCKNSDGGITYQQFPCAKDSEQNEIKVSGSGGDERDTDLDDKNFVISKNNLLGTWTDYYPRTAYSSTWTFTSSTMTFKKYNGRVISLPYTLTENKIIVHHKKNFVNKEDWDEEHDLVSFKDNILLWRSITNVRLHKVL